MGEEIRVRRVERRGRRGGRTRRGNESDSHPISINWKKAQRESATMFRFEKIFEKSGRRRGRIFSSLLHFADGIPFENIPFYFPSLQLFFHSASRLRMPERFSRLKFTSLRSLINPRDVDQPLNLFNCPFNYTHQRHQTSSIWLILRS